MSLSNSSIYYGDIQQRRIDSFCRKTGIKDFNIAEEYLDSCDWEEKRAVEKFFKNHPNHNPYQNHDCCDYDNSNPKPFLSPPPTQVSHKNSSKKKDLDKNKDKDKDKDININNEKQIINDYFTFNFSKLLNENNNNNNKKESLTLQYIIKELKEEISFNSFMKLLKNQRGIILVFKEQSFDRIKEQMTIIKRDPLNSTIIQNCVILPVLNSSSMGKEIIQKLSIISYPTYIFCKYKDEQNIYITDKMEGGFEISFFINSILRIQPGSNYNLYNHKNNNNSSVNKENVNKNNKNENNNIIQNLKNDKYFNGDLDNIKKISSHRKMNIDLSKYNNKNNSNINNHNDNKNNDNKKKKIPINKQNNNNKDNNNNSNNIIKKDNNNNDNMVEGEYFLGDSMDILKIFNDNNNNNNKYDNNNYYNNNNIYNNYENEKNEKIIDAQINDDDNILRDSIYQLTDAQVLQKRERQMRELERQQEEKERKEEEEKKKKEEEENRLKNIKNKYEEESKIAKMILPEEPKGDGPDICHIVFRVPDGSKNMERKFLKNDKISSLYNYVKSIGREIFMEPDATDFDLLSSDFPPKNLEKIKNSTLEKEGLYPNSIIQIREK